MPAICRILGATWHPITRPGEYTISLVVRPIDPQPDGYAAPDAMRCAVAPHVTLRIRNGGRGEGIRQYYDCCQHLPPQVPRPDAHQPHITVPHLVGQQVIVATTGHLGGKSCCHHIIGCWPPVEAQEGSE